MLTLTRRTGEVIVIDTPQGKVEIMLIEASRDKVRLGISAPQDLTIYRAELGSGYKRPHKEENRNEQHR